MCALTSAAAHQILVAPSTSRQPTVDGREMKGRCILSKGRGILSSAGDAGSAGGGGIGWEAVQRSTRVAHEYAKGRQAAW